MGLVAATPAGSVPHEMAATPGKDFGCMRFLRYALLLLVIALIGPSAAAVLATGSPKKSPEFRVVSASPADFNVSGIEFGLDKGANATPIASSDRFAFGIRHIWAFWAWDNAKSGQTVRYTLKFGGTDVAWGELKTDDNNGRMEVELERMDGDYLMVGTFRLYVEPVGGDSGATRIGEFTIYDPDHHDNGNSNNNGNHNNNNNNDNNNNGKTNDNNGNNNDNNDNNDNNRNDN